jgi:hypothetical protein
VAGRHEPGSRASFYVSLATAVLRAALVALAVALGIFVLSKAFPGDGQAITEEPGAPATVPAPPPGQTVSPLPTRASPQVSEPSEVSIQVLNGTSVSGLADETRLVLEDAGYDVLTIGNANRSYETTTLFYHPRSQVDAEALAQQFFPGAILEETAPDADVDVTVIIGADYAATQEAGEVSPTPTETA